MPCYLIGIMFHEPESFALWHRGVIEDYESTTGLFIDAHKPDEAIAWGERVGQSLLRHCNKDDSLDWKSFGYYCWIEESPALSCWKHCLDFFLRVQTGEMPDLNQMGTAAYTKWQEKHGT